MEVYQPEKSEEEVTAPVGVGSPKKVGRAATGVRAVNSSESSEGE